jgi:LuxR family maltose regulon positive regulatory protein
MHLNLSIEDITALETRTEGWIAGLQLAALAMQGSEEPTNFIQAFTGSHHFILDYLIEEVLQQQPEDVQTFLLRTSILDRMCGPLCDAVLGHPSISGQETLEMLERANLFIVPLDSERRWYRYHHLFGDLLRQRYQQSAGKSPLDGSADIAELNIRASQWFEENGLGIEAFHHAAVAKDMDRAERLMEGKGIPLHLSSTITTILNWLASLPTSTKDARPLLWVRSATMLLINGQSTGVEEKLQAGEKAITACLNGAEPDEKYRDLIGQIAAARATLALSLYQVGEIISQSQRAMEYLAPDNLAYRFTAIWTLANAYLIQGNRTEAGETFIKAVEISRISGEPISIILALSGLAQVQELENQLYSAEEAYRQVLQLVGELPLPNACVAELGLARIYYEWNDLSAAELHGQQSLKLARQYDRVIDRSIMSDVFLARLKLAQGDVAGAAALITGAEESVRRLNFVERMPDLAAAKVLVLIRQGDLSAAAHLATAHNLHLSQARVYLAEGNPSAALANLEPLLPQMEAQGWVDEYLKVMILQSLVLHANGEKDKALQWLGKALRLAEPGGFIRIFVDEGTPMVSLLLDAASEGIRPDYIRKLLSAFEAENQKSEDKPVSFPAQYPIGPLSHRELEILKLIARGLSNREIGERLFLALDTIKGHNRRIFDKLQVQNRTEAIARAREMDLL